MLTDKERNWLERRSMLKSRTGIYSTSSINVLSIVSATKKLTPDWPDAAEFEARVAKKLAYGVSYGELPCGADPDCPDKHMDKYNTKETPSLGCRMCVLRAARFEIEAKMEEEGKRV